MSKNPHPDLEPIASLDVPTADALGAAALSAAATFKRIVDLLEPFAKIALAELQQQQTKKGKG